MNPPWYPSLDRMYFKYSKELMEERIKMLRMEEDENKEMEVQEGQDTQQTT